MDHPVATRRSIVTAALSVLLPGSAGAQTANSSNEAFPTRPVRLVVPTPPGTAPDIRSRQLAQKLGEEWQQPVIVDNRPGASERLAMEAVLQAPSDGYTMMMGLHSMVTLSQLTKMAFDPLKEFVAVSKVSSGPFILFAYPGSPFSSVAELVAHARANPGKLNAANPGVGTLPHLAVALFSKTAGVEMLSVPYGGGGGAKMTADLIAGQVQLLFNVASPVLPHLKSGRIRALAVASQSRLAILPEVPTFGELGYPAMDVTGWQGVFVRSGTPPEVITKMNKALVKALNLPDIRQAIEDTGGVVGGDSAEQFATFVRSEHTRWGKVISDAAIRLE